MRRISSFPDFSELAGQTRLSVEQLTEIYRKIRWFRYDHEYPRDRHFEPCFRHIRTRADVELFLAELEADRVKTGVTGACSKVRSIRNALGINIAGWDRLEDQIMHTLTSARRICCWCHETGSYALYEETR